MSESVSHKGSFKKFIKNNGIYILLVVCFAACMLFARYINTHRAIDSSEPSKPADFFSAVIDGRYENTSYLVPVDDIRSGESIVYKFEVKCSIDTFLSGEKLEYCIELTSTGDTPYTYILRKNLANTSSTAILDIVNGSTAMQSVPEGVQADSYTLEIIRSFSTDTNIDDGLSDDVLLNIRWEKLAEAE